jgi:Holliday junction resolvase RusA-like endonuclease
MIKLIIPGEPCAKQRPRVCKFGTYTPTKTVNYEALIQQLYIIGNHGKQLEGQLGMFVVAYFSIPKSTPKAKLSAIMSGKTRPTKKPDWDNIGKIISDALNGLAYRDDSQIVTATVQKQYSPDNPRVEVEIFEIL